MTRGRASSAGAQEASVPVGLAEAPAATDDEDPAAGAPPVGDPRVGDGLAGGGLDEG
ncbi:hypothetical protein ACXR2U_22445 [Jatrophihabitans sp. YIM 134969]